MKFDYYVPKTLDDALAFLSEHKDEARVVAGGTDVVVQARKGLLNPRYLVDITEIDALDAIEYREDGTLVIGSLTTISAVEKSELVRRHHPIIAQAAGLLASPAIRNQATVGGNLCNAAPSAETAPALLATEAKMGIVGIGTERTVAVNQFFLSPGRTVIGAGELLTRITVAPMAKDAKGIYRKQAIRGSVDCAISGVAVVLQMDRNTKTCKDVKIALGAVAPTPIRAIEAEKVLINHAVTEKLIEDVARMVADGSKCITDVRSTADYREEMVYLLTKNILTDLVSA